MNRLPIAATAFIALSIMLGSAGLRAQSMDDLNLQVHGYATQAFVYSTSNNWNTVNSTDGSAAWTEAVVNVTAQPQRRLHVGMQARYFLLGNYGNDITLDWAQVDFKVNEHFGLRAGKVKTPIGLLNEIEDIDPAYLWILLPQSVYPLASRNSVLTHFGGIAYGSFSLGESLGKLSYHAFAGTHVLGGNDGYFQPMRDQGMSLPNGLSGPVYGATLKWHTPIHGLTVGGSETPQRWSGAIAAGPLLGTVQGTRMTIPYFFAQYDRSRLMVAGEYSRVPVSSTTTFPSAGPYGPPPINFQVDSREFYAMASYRFTEKLNGGLYYSSSLDRKSPVSSARYQKDWALSARYDFSSYLYLKAEQHFVDGTTIGYSMSNNAGGLKPDSRMTLFKLGVSF